MTHLLAVVRLPSEVVGLCCVAICFLKLSVLVFRGLRSGVEGLRLACGLPRACGDWSWLSKVLPVALAVEVEAEATGALE